MILKMNSYSIFVLIFITTGFASTVLINSSISAFEANQSEAILSEILSDFLLTYFSEKRIFISIIFASSTKGRSDFNEEFLRKFIEDSALINFAWTVSDKLNEGTLKERNVFNLILIDESKLLK